MSASTWPTFSTHDDPLDALVKLSRHYGGDPSFVLAGGGNTSVKVGDTLHVKASGTALATVDPGGFVALDRRALRALAQAPGTADVLQREEAYKTAILAARLHPECGLRPSVECLFHELVPGTFVVHTHATVVNALTCCVRGQALAAELFGDEILWVPFIDPGLTLGQHIGRAWTEHLRAHGGKAPRAVLMANHGLIVAGDTPDEVRAHTDYVLGKVAARLAAAPPAPLSAPGDKSTAPGDKSVTGNAAVNVLAPLLRGLLAQVDAEGGAVRLPIVTFDDSPAVMQFVSSPAGRQAALGGPLTPDQIVYCGSFPLWFETGTDVTAAGLLPRLRQALADHAGGTGSPARVVLAAGLGLFAVGADFAAADTARALYADAIAVMAGAARLGGVNHLTAGQRQFIENWEVEAYRKKVAAGSGSAGRVAGKVAVVTGAAQGFGLEIAQALCAQGAHVALTDVNDAGVKAAASALAARAGAGRVLGLAVNVTDPDSVAACLHQVVRRYGGIDLLVSNAGVLRAGSVKTQPVQDFDFVTAVNYKGYFVCVQQAAPLMALTHQACPGCLTDIIQINSKSGLQGSNKNSAYAGSKFGGIGLTQSFALELIEDGIKVNAICPGNFFDGPLWSDPRHGLFVQYLNTGKVPGARTIEDVKRFYEAKVPMGRGCRTQDVMRALYYLVDQQYETGQAVPVTGGQVMLS